MPQISVVMANYNCAAFIGPAILSLRAQTFTDWELLLIDDASTDASVSAAREAAASDPRVIILEQPANGGAAKARNRGFDEARGEWVAVFDSDDLMAPQRLQRLLDQAAASAADIVADNILLAAPEGISLFIPEEKARRLGNISLPAFIRSNCLYADLPSLGYLKPLFRRSAIGEFRYAENLRNGEDYDLVTRIMARGARLSLLPEALYTYRIHDSSVSRTWTETDLQGLLKANAVFADENAPLGEELAKAVARRRRTLKANLVFTRMVNDLKSRTIFPGLGQAVLYPPSWPLVSRPVKARLRRVAKALKRARAPGAAPTASDVVHG